MMDPDMMGGEFGQLIQQAAKLKGAQMAKDKRRFETWPKYLQHTMYNQEKLAEIRALPAAERLERASALKDEGNELVKDGRHGDAMGVYEKALGVYYYVHNREPEWKTKGINDADVKIVDDAAEDSGEEIAQQVRQLKLSVLLNISLAAQHAHDQGLVARACTDALKLDSTNSKALWRRATAYRAMGSATEFDMAIADMRTAHGLDPSDARVGKRLKEWSAERKQQKRTEIKTFGGMFERGSMSVAGEDTGAAAAAEGGGSSCGSGGGRGQFERYSSMAELEADVAKMKDALSAAEYNNNRAEARMLRQRLRNIDEWLEKAKAKAIAEAQKKAMPDWSNPSEKDIQEAKEHGLDLTDPAVQAELIKLSKDKADGLSDGDEGSGEGGAEGAKHKKAGFSWKIAITVGLAVMVFRSFGHIYQLWSSRVKPVDPESLSAAEDYLNEELQRNNEDL